MAASKEEVANTILARSPLTVLLDPRREGVVVPARFGNDAELRLVVGRALKIPILDLVLDARGIRGTLSFDGAPFSCELPWAAIYALGDENGKAVQWPDDVPKDLPPPPKPSRHEAACSMCERTRVEVGYLVAAERASICNVCVAEACAPGTLYERIRAFFFAEVVAEGTAPTGKSPYRDASPTACSFCGSEHPRMVHGTAARICRPCVLLSRDVIREGIVGEVSG